MPFLIIVTLVFVATILRFLFLHSSPPGFYIDEAAISAQVICLKQSGADLAGHAWPLFVQVLGGGYATPSYLYSGVAWTSVFGDSVSSFRAMAAFYSALFIGGSYLLGTRFWKSKQAGWFCALAAALSPWAFQFARIAWDPALAPAFSVWAFALLWSKGRYEKLEAVLGGLCLSLAAYSYPPLRVQLAIMTPFALGFLIVREKKSWVSGLIFGVAALVFSIPLIQMTLSGELQGRFAMLSVFNPDYLRQFGEPSFGLGLSELIKNFASHFSLNYLAHSGDANLRHSTQSFGQWSWLDLFALLTAFGTFLYFGYRRKLKAIVWVPIVFVVIGYLAGILPAAMTWESNPHALRSIGAVVFLSLGVGGVLNFAWNFKALRVSTVAVSIAFLALFAKDFFTEYPQRSYLWFDSVIPEMARRLAEQGESDKFASELIRSGINYDPMAVRYYELANGTKHCPLSVP
jgi:hypothetical protein